ncbi:MAG: Na+/H+ antiporter NhaC family protein [Opitutaceae bacterium]
MTTSASFAAVNPWRQPRRWIIAIAAVAIACLVLAFLPTTRTAGLGGRPIGQWTSLLPPIVAVVIALCFRQIVAALLAAFFLGAALAFGPLPWIFLPRAAIDLVWVNLTASFSLAIFGFLFSLVGLVHVISRSGGVQGLVAQLTRAARGPRSARLAAMLAGLVVFFDDYSNTIVVGTTMRPLFDRFRISREKLAYIVDSTSAPVAGLALISTWIAFEVFLFGQAVEGLGVAEDGFGIFLAALPMRFYCIGTLIFVAINAALHRDFGPMLRAEQRAAIEGKMISDTARPLSGRASEAMKPAEGAPRRWYNAAAPLVVVIAGTAAGIVWLGRDRVLASGGTFSFASAASWREAFGAVSASESGAMGVLFCAALAGGIVAIAMAKAQRILTIRESARAWLGSIPMLWMALFILVMAWSMKSLCTDFLNTDTYLVALLGDRMPLEWLPLAAFLTGAAMSFALGTSWGTMGMLIPVLLPLAHALGAYEEGSRVIFWLTCAAVLDGAIFGDHCSPISDTTVLSSLASGCDHLDHTTTQLGYAIPVMLLAAGLGYVPTAFGLPAAAYFAIFPIAAAALFFTIGKPVASVPADRKSV